MNQNPPIDCTPTELMQANQYLYYVKSETAWNDYQYDKFCDRFEMFGGGGSDRADSYTPKVIALAEDVLKRAFLYPPETWQPKPFQKGDMVYLKWRGHWTEFTLQHLHDWQSTCTITNGNGEHTCKASELITKEAYDKIVWEKRREELRREHACLLVLWGNGPEKPSRASRRRLVGVCAQELGCSPSGLGRTLAMLERYGLIKYDKPPTD